MHAHFHLHVVSTIQLNYSNTVGTVCLIVFVVRLLFILLNVCWTVVILHRS